MLEELIQKGDPSLSLYGLENASIAVYRPAAANTATATEAVSSANKLKPFYYLW